MVPRGLLLACVLNADTRLEEGGVISPLAFLAHLVGEHATTEVKTSLFGRALKSSLVILVAGELGLSGYGVDLVLDMLDVDILGMFAQHVIHDKALLGIIHRAGKGLARLAVPECHRKVAHLGGLGTVWLCL